MSVLPCCLSVRRDCARTDRPRNRSARGLLFDLFAALNRRRELVESVCAYPGLPHGREQPGTPLRRCQQEDHLGQRGPVRNDEAANWGGLSLDRAGGSARGGPNLSHHIPLRKWIIDLATGSSFWDPSLASSSDRSPFNALPLFGVPRPSKGDEVRVPKSFRIVEHRDDRRRHAKSAIVNP